MHLGPLPEAFLQAARSALLARRNILVSGRMGSGKTTLLNALIELLPEDERIVAIKDTLELRIDRTNCLRFEAGATLSETAVSIRDLIRHALRHRPVHIVVGEVRGAEAADLLQALTTVHANNARSALSRLASCAMQAGTRSPGGHLPGRRRRISLILHMTRQRGRRFVEEAIEVRSYDKTTGRWITEPISSGAPKPRKEEQTYTPKRGERMKGNDGTIRIDTLDDFDREFARDGGETLEVPAHLAEHYGLFPEEVGTEDEIVDAGGDPHGEEDGR